MEVDHSALRELPSGGKVTVEGEVEIAGLGAFVEVGDQYRWVVYPRSRWCQTCSWLGYWGGRGKGVSIWLRGWVLSERDQTLASLESEASTALVSVNFHHPLLSLFG